MSRDYYPFDEQLISTLSARTVHHMTPFEAADTQQNFSAAFEGATFSSGSSVLSAFEPPTDTDILEKASLAQLLDENRAYTGRLEDLRTLIDRLQAIYFYRQGLQALASERGCLHASISSGSSAGESRSFVKPSLVIGAPASIPGVMDSIWKMDDHQLSLAARAVEAAAVEKSMTTECLPPHTPSHPPPEAFLGSVSGPPPAQTTESAQRGYRRKSRRQRSCPVALCAPQWADATWDPKTSVKSHNHSSSHGTGVFIPPHLAQSPALEGGGSDREIGTPQHHFLTKSQCETHPTTLQNHNNDLIR